MNASKTLLLSVIALTLLGAGCAKKQPLPVGPAPQAPSENVNEKPTGIPVPLPIDANSSSTVVDNPTGSDVKNPIVYPEGKDPLRPRPAGEICDAQNFICTSSLLVHSEVSKTFSVTGTGVAFENTINWRIEEGGKKIAEGFTTADAPDVGKPGLFTIAATDVKATTKSVDLIIFEYSAKDGTPIHELRIPLRIK